MLGQIEATILSALQTIFDQFGWVLSGIRMLVSIPAGLARIPFPKFFFATFIGAYIWCTLSIGAGYLLGHEWMLISDYIKTHMPLVASAAAVVVGVYLAWHFRKRIPVLAWIKTRKLDNNEL